MEIWFFFFSSQWCTLWTIQQLYLLNKTQIFLKAVFKFTIVHNGSQYFFLNDKMNFKTTSGTTLKKKTKYKLMAFL